MKKNRTMKSSLRNRSLAAASRRRVKIKNVLRKINNRKRAIFNQDLFECQVTAA